MINYTEYKIAQQNLQKQQEALYAEALEHFSARPLPQSWKVGQKIEYIRTSEYVWDKGEIGVVVEILEEYAGKPAKANQVFYTRPIKLSSGTFYTTPRDVILISEG